MKQKPKPKSKNARHSSDTQANKLIAWAGKTILGPGVKERIKRDAARPRSNTGILFLPEWQDAVLDNPQPAKKRDPQ
jgi:hypothetical protein